MAKNETAPEGEAKNEPKVEAKPEPKKRPPYSIADGKSLVVQRGVLSPGDEITARDFGDEKVGREQLDYLVSRGYVVKS